MPINTSLQSNKNKQERKSVPKTRCWFASRFLAQ